MIDENKEFRVYRRGDQEAREGSSGILRPTFPD
jgi:hypothetical protein